MDYREKFKVNAFFMWKNLQNHDTIYFRGINFKAVILFSNIISLS